MLQQGMAGPAQGRMRQGAGAASGGVEDILGALLGGGGQSGAAQGDWGLGVKRAMLAWESARLEAAEGA
ncbi:MAG: hypothetical protein CO163_04180 [Rhodobacterales bacterium CG_4_9_14_3_um_filter_71_31]|nr:MAG: hypothetical protein CO163_04180 [Rhodobacterales bacterium CG_4_9_14_3_um_filter_71_31]